MKDDDCFQQQVPTFVRHNSGGLNGGKCEM